MSSYEYAVIPAPSRAEKTKGAKTGIDRFAATLTGAINEMALRVLSPGGILLTCSCSTHLALNDFRFLLSEAGARARRTLTFLEVHTHGIDHPQLVPFMEGEYLKCFFVKA